MLNSDLLSPTAKESIDKLPFFMKYVINVLLDCIDNIINGKCDEDIIVSAMSTMNNNARGKYSNEDLMNYDEAGEVLGFGTTNRVGLKRLLDKHGIKQVVINNMKCGFRRDEILSLKDKLCIKKSIKTYKHKHAG